MPRPTRARGGTCSTFCPQFLRGRRFFLLLTRRLLVASAISAALLGIILTASAVKLELMHMALHAYDVVFYLTSPATLSFLVQTYPLQMLCLFGAFGLVGFGWYLLHQRDTTRVPRLFSVALLAGLAAFSSHAAAHKDVLYAFQQFEGGFTVTKFLNSWRETIDTMVRGQLFEAAAKTSLPPFRQRSPAHLRKSHRIFSSSMRKAWCRPSIFRSFPTTKPWTGCSGRSTESCIRFASRRTQAARGSPSFRC